jgi:uncharacterized protein (TIGR02145 family)
MKRVIKISVVVTGLAIGMVSSLCAEGITLPYTFSAGETAKANEVNANFETLKNAVNTTAVIAPKGYGVIYAGGHAWLDRNLGATSVCTSVMGDATCRGDLYQWGRPTDGHEKRDSATQVGPIGDIIPEHGDFITGAAHWLNFNAIYLWQNPGKSMNGVCPAGWSVPTMQDFEDLAFEDISDAFNKLKLTLDGYRRRTDGTVKSIGIYGFYWAATVLGDEHAYSLQMSSEDGKVKISGNYLNNGFSVRCVKHLH